MDISSELSAVATRIEQITGAPVQLPGLPEQAPQAGSFAALLQAQLAGAGRRASKETTLRRMPPRWWRRRKSMRWSMTTRNRKTVDPALIKAIIANESGFNANATSNVGAQGLMQLMPGTAAGLGVTDAYDPAQNVAGGTKYIKGLLGKFNGDVRLAVAAYNAGPGAVEKYGGVPPYAETQNYVQNVLASYAKYRGIATP